MIKTLLELKNLRNELFRLRNETHKIWCTYNKTVDESIKETEPNIKRQNEICDKLKKLDEEIIIMLEMNEIDITFLCIEGIDGVEEFFENV